MGADIHMVLEKRWKDRWVGVNAFPYATAEVYDFDRRKVDPHASVVAQGGIHWPVKSRNYDLFAALAGVRGTGPEPRGVPDDVSDLAQLEIEGWGADGHSHSWMLMSEAMPIFLRYQLDGVKKIMRGNTSQKKLSLSAMAYFYAEIYEDDSEDDQETLDDYRLVFWFDN